MIREQQLPRHPAQRLTVYDSRLFPMPNIVNVGYKSTNYYAIDIMGGKLLVDCGWPGTLPQFTAAMKRMGVSPSDIKYILATHYHPDHAGLVEEFKRQGATLLLMENQLETLQPAPVSQPGRTPAFIHVSPHNVVQLRCNESRAFLATLGLAGEIVATPGHSDDSVTLLLDDGTAFTGDLPPRMIVSDEDVVSKASWDRIRALHASRVFPAHGTQS